MYINGPWGRGQHKEGLNVSTVRIPAGPQGSQGTLLITDSIAVFNNTGVEEHAMALASIISSGDSQYSLDTDWGLTFQSCSIHKLVQLHHTMKIIG